MESSRRLANVLGHLRSGEIPSRATPCSKSLSDRDVCIVAAVRTPLGDFNGSLASFSAVQLGSIAIKEALSRSGLKPNDVDEVFFGNVLSAGIGQAPARQAALGAGIPNTVPCTTVNKVCSSGMKTIIFAHNAIIAGEADVVVVGGMESMTNVPYYLPKARFGQRMGDGVMVDGMMADGLTDAYDRKPMGNCAELCSKEYNISRQAQDAYAARSFERAAAAVKNGLFKQEIVPVKIEKGGKTTVVDKDDRVSKVKADALGGLKPAFAKDKGTVTAGNASSISDGAAALVLCSGKVAREKGLKVLGRVGGVADSATDPAHFTIAPSMAIEKLFKKTNTKLSEVDLFEVNEAFSVVALANAQILGLPEDKTNTCGGAVSLGHPLGASGARIVVTLLHALSRLDKHDKVGVAGICNGGGGASALLIRA